MNYENKQGLKLFNVKVSICVSMLLCREALAHWNEAEPQTLTTS